MLGEAAMRRSPEPKGVEQEPEPRLGLLLVDTEGREDAPLPNFVSIAPFRQFSPTAYGPGFLGPQYAPLLVGDIQNFNGGLGLK